MFNYVPFASDAPLPSMWNVQTAKALLSCLWITWVSPYIRKILEKLNKPNEGCFVLQSSYSYTEEFGPLRQWALKGKRGEHCAEVNRGKPCSQTCSVLENTVCGNTAAPFLSCNGKTRRGVTLCALLDVTVCTVTLGEPLGCLSVSSAVKLISWGSS